MGLLRRRGEELLIEPAKHAFHDPADPVDGRGAVFIERGLDGDAPSPVDARGVVCGQYAAPPFAGRPVVLEGRDHDDRAVCAGDSPGGEDPDPVDLGDRDPARKVVQVRGDRAGLCYSAGVGRLDRRIHAPAVTGSALTRGGASPSSASASASSTKWRRTWRKSWALVMTPNAWCVPRSLSLLTTNSEVSTAIVVSGRISPSSSTT